MASKIKFLLTLVSVFFCLQTYSQEQRYTPISSDIFSPFIYNPAMAGNKDYSTIDVTSIMAGDTKAQLLNVSTRILKRVPGYYYYKDAKDFSNFGFGASLFNQANSVYHNAGISGTLAYHLSLDKSNLSFISIGTSVKAIYSFNQHSVRPFTDVGVYYYGISFFAGFAANNLGQSSKSPDSLGNYNPPLLKKYLLTLGYKFYISQKSNIVFEPSFVINGNDSTLSKLPSSIHPLLKLYVENVCFGTYFNDYNRISLFLQYKFIGFYLGAFFEVPRKSPYYLYNGQPILELSLGLNISNNKQQLLIPGRW